MYYYVYVLESTIRNYRYVGLSCEPDVRLHRHNAGQNRTTTPYAPFKRIVIERYPSRQEARKREKYL